MDAYRRIPSLDGKPVHIVITLLLLDGTLDSRLAAVFNGNREGNRNSGDDAVDHGFARLTLHSYRKNKNEDNSEKTFLINKDHSPLLKVTLTL